MVFLILLVCKRLSFILAVEVTWSHKTFTSCFSYCFRLHPIFVPTYNACHLCIGLFYGMYFSNKIIHILWIVDFGLYLTDTQSAVVYSCDFFLTRMVLLLRISWNMFFFAYCGLSTYGRNLAYLSKGKRV